MRPPGSRNDSRLLRLLLLQLLLACGVCSPPPWSGPHIAELNVLLPPRMTNPVQYRLVGTGGCFSWSWDHHDILSVQPEYNGTDGCSTSALLMSIAPYSGRKEMAVYASDFRSGAVIRCEVFIDKIARVQIFHHSVKLDLGSLYTLRIRAFDENENVFSSLVGVQFSWSLMSKSDDDLIVPHRLVHVPLMETPLSDSGGVCSDLDTQIKLENKGVGSDLYVVKGTEIGHEIVTAHMLEPQAEHMIDKIVLTVAEMMSLEPPSPLFVVIDALIQYKLVVIRQRSPKVINLPSLYHQWSISNSTTVKIDERMGTVLALNLGIASVVVEDTRVTGHKQMSIIHVVIPERLVLYITPVTDAFDPLKEVRHYPSHTWYVVAGQQYVVHMNVFSPKPEEKEIYLTKSNEFKMESNNLKLLHTSSVPSELVAKYGWKHSQSLRPQTEGNGALRASLAYHRGNPEKVEFLKIEQEIVVCNRLSIHFENKGHANVIRLPWTPGLHQEVKLIAYGGCAKASKDYEWFSSDRVILYVSASGVIRANHPGRAIVKVVSSFDTVNFAEVVVEVSIPSSISMLPYFPVEAIVGKQLLAAVALNSPDGEYYHKCDVFSSSIRWKVFSGRECFEVINTTDALDFHMLSNIEGSECCSSCAWTYLHTYCPAQAMLHATFLGEIKASGSSLEGKIILKASKRVSAYPPLVVQQAGNGNQFGGYWVNSVNNEESEVRGSSPWSLREIYLVPGTAIDVMLLGGPDRWEEGVDFIDNVDINGDKHRYMNVETVVKRETRNGGRLYRVLCQTVGNYKLKFSRGNLIGDGHPLQAVEILDVDIFCSFPSLITLIANENASTLDVIQSSIQDARGPESTHLTPISVANDRAIRVAAVGIHTSGQLFANCSSLRLEWELRGCQDLAHWDENFRRQRLLSTWERFLLLHNSSGQCMIRASVAGFDPDMAPNFLDQAHLFSESFKSLADAITLQVVPSMGIIPDYILLIFHPDAKANISVTGGTCLLEPLVNDTRVTEVLHNPGTTPCSLLTLGSRGLGTALLTIYDRGLSPPAAATALVEVADVEWIKLISADETFILEGSMKTFEIQAGTQDGSTFDSSQYLYMNIHVHVDGNMVKLINEDASSIVGDHRINQPCFSVKAEQIGITSTYVSFAGLSGNSISSQHVTIEVYPALRLQPSYIFLSPGASYKVSVKGGPTLGVIVEYKSLNDEIATTHKKFGKVSANSLGNATLHVAYYANGGDLVCEAFGQVEVGVPPMIFLNVQSEQLCVGCEMPIFPSYPEGNLFSFYDVCKDYRWVVEDPKVLKINSFGSSYLDTIERHSFDGGETDSYGIGDEYGFMNSINGRSAGKSKVFVSFSCNFVSIEGRISRTYNASQTVRVIPELPLALGIPMTWVLPPFYTTSEILPDSYEMSEQGISRQHKRSISYSLLRSCEKKSVSQDAISVVGNRIRTRESNNLGCLQAKDQTGRVEIACCVRIAEVSQVRICTKDFCSYVVQLGVNDRLELPVGYCDSIGYPFLEAYGIVPLDIETNNHDVVSVHMPSYSERQNGSKYIVHLQARRQGKALVKIFINNDQRKATYISILVGSRVVPRNPFLCVGNFLNFSTIGDGATDLLLGHWSSSNESVIHINKLTGEAHARAEGLSQVYFENSDVKLQTTVTVFRNEHIVVHAPEAPLTNVPFSSEGYMFSVRLSDSLEQKRYNVGPKSDLTYDCRVEPPFFGYTKPWIDPASSDLYCLFFPYSPEHLVSFAAKINTTGGVSDGKGIAYITIVASLREAQHISGSAHALFIGGFAVSEVGMLNFSLQSNKTKVTVIGNTDVQIHWNFKDILTVKPVFEDNFGVGGRVEYEVMLLKLEKFSDKITIVLPATGQRVQLNVQCDPGEESGPSRTITALWIGVVSFILLLLTVVIFVRLLDRPDAHGPSRPQTTPPIATSLSPATPERTTRATQSDVRTPQPFMEYVRRTLDETPYYKREGRRRFNPQNTY